MIITLPGYENSGPGHWQTHWDQQLRGARRLEPTSWMQPELGDWMEALDRAVAAAPPEIPIVLVAHSIGTLLVGHWAKRAGLEERSRIGGAFLVAAPDPDGAAFPPPAASFTVPAGPLPFPSLLLTSSDDWYGSVDFATAVAHSWGSRHIVLGAYGHLNAASGLGDWPGGRALLTAFEAGLGIPA